VPTRLEVDLPSASDYSDLDTPNGSPDPDLITVMSKTSGMYADTKIVEASAKVRLGKRKAENGDCDRTLYDRIKEKRKKSEFASVLGELKTNQIDELQLKPVRTLEESSPCRNPSPPPSPSGSSASSRSPSPVLRSRSPASRSPSPALRSPSPSPPLSQAKLLSAKSTVEKLVTKKKKKDKIKKNKKSKKEERKKSKKTEKSEKSEKPGKEEKKKRSNKRKSSTSPSRVLKSVTEADENSSPSKKTKPRTDTVLETRTVRVREDKESLDVLQQLDDLINE